MSDPGTVTTKRLLAAFFAQADGLERFIERRIPRRFQKHVTAGDVLQDVCITMFKSPPKDLRHVEAWFATVASTRLADAVRAHRARKRGGGRRLYSMGAQHITSLEDLFAKLSGGVNSPSREVSAREARQAVQVALGALPEEYREVVRLRHFEGRSQREIACTMDKTEAAVNGLLFRALRQMRRHLGDAAQFFSDVRSSEAVP